MADNVVANAGSGGATFRSFSDGTDQWPATIPAYVTGGSAGTWSIQYVQMANALPVQPGTSTTWAATQSGTWSITNVSGTISLPTGAATAAKQPALGTAGSASSDVITIQGIASMTAVKVDGSGVTQPVSGTFWQATQPVSVASLPLPTGASTSAKQPALGTAGSASSDVITVQGIASMTALKVDGSAATQPISGTVTANIGTSGSLALDATLTGGTAKAQMYDGSNVIGTSAHPVQVSLANTAANSTAVKVDGSAVTQPVSGTVSANPAPTTSGGCSIERLLSAASTNATSVKASAGQVYGMYCHNINASPRFLKLYNKASSPTVGTDTPVMTLPIPGNANGAGFVLPMDMGIAFGTGIALAVTGAVGDSDTTTVAANEVVVNLFYK